MAEEKRIPQTTGSFARPYRKEDGTKMAKYSIHARIDFVNTLRRHIAALGVGVKENEYVMNAVLEKIRRDIAARGRTTPHD